MELSSIPSLPSLEGAAVKFAVEVLKIGLERKDLRDKVLLEVENAGLKRALEAQIWATSSSANLELGVRDPTKHIEVE